MGIGRNVSRSIGRDVVRDIGIGGGTTPPPPVGNFIWDAANASAVNTPTLDITKQIATFSAVPAGTIGAIKVVPAGFLPDLVGRVIGFRFLAGSGTLIAAVFGGSNSTFNVDNLFGTLFGNSTLALTVVEFAGSASASGGVDSVGGLAPLNTKENTANGDIFLLYINGTDWRFFENGVRKTNARLQPDGGAYNIALNEIFCAVFNQDAVAGAVSIELVDLASTINAAGFSTQWIPAGARDLNGNVIGQAGNKLIWGRASNFITILNRLSDSQATCDFSIPAGSKSVQGGTTAYDTADFSGYVVQEFEITALSGLDINYAFQLNTTPTDVENTQFLKLQYNHSSTSLQVSDDTGGSGFTGATTGVTLSIGDKFLHAVNPVTLAAQVDYKPVAGSQVTIDSGTLGSFGNWSFTMSSEDFTQTGGQAISLKQTQGGAFTMAVPGGSVTPYGDAP